MIAALHDLALGIAMWVILGAAFLFMVIGKR
jgi:hypothetical protein